MPILISYIPIEPGAPSLPCNPLFEPWLVFPALRFSAFQLTTPIYMLPLLRPEAARRPIAFTLPQTHPKTVTVHIPPTASYDIVAPETLVARMAEMDKDGNGYVTYPEFLMAFCDWVGVEDEDDDDDA